MLNLSQFSFRWLIVAVFLLSVGTVNAAGARFQVASIDVKGIKRIDLGTVLTYLPVREGDLFDPTTDTSRAIRALYETGLFSDVTLYQRDHTLVVELEERPAIADIEIDGNEKVTTEQLNDSLTTIGLSKGRAYNQSLLDKIEQELRRLYFSTGNYGMRIEKTVEDLPRNRVLVKLKIEEGSVALIRQLNIVGNKAFDDETLLDLLKSGVVNFNPFSGADEYSRVKLEGDLEILRSYYQDRGYIRFNIDSHQVSLSADKQKVFITINIDEGEKYSIRATRVVGETVVDSEELNELAKQETGSVFSRKDMVKISSALTDRLGDEGFAFADVKVVPEVDDEKKEVKLVYNLIPGERAYVRRIIFTGQYKTRDDVLRREMRQIEGSRFSPQLVSRSRTRLQRLPYLSNVTVDTRRVAGSENQLDLIIRVTEGSSGSFGATAGYGSNGFIFNINLTQENIFGTGERLQFAFDTSTTTDQFSVSHRDPYFTENGISRTISAFVKKTDASAISSSDNYVLDSYGAKVNFGVPMSEFTTFRLGAGYEHVKITGTEGSSDEVNEFLASSGKRHDIFTADVGITHDTRNRTVFATKGALNEFSLSTTLGFGDLDYYKLNYELQYYYPVASRYTFSASTRISYGDGYKDFDQLPFFRRYYAGGVRTLRGYKNGTLGPRDSNDNAAGGDFRTLGTLEVIFPPPFVEEPGATRFSLFSDFGYVFKDVTDYEQDELRGSYGIAFVWLSPVGALTFSWAKPYNEEPEDETQTFQFTIGSIF